MKKNLSIWELASRIKNLNPERLKGHYLVGGYDDKRAIIVTDIEMGALQYPEGYAFNSKNNTVVILNQDKSFPVIRAEKLVQ